MDLIRAAHQDHRHSEAQNSCILCKAERIKGTDNSKVYHHTLLPKKCYDTNKHLSFFNRSSSWSEAACWRGVFTFAQEQLILGSWGVPLGKVLWWQLRVLLVSLPPLAPWETDSCSITEPLPIHSSPLWVGTLSLYRTGVFHQWVEHPAETASCISSGEKWQQQPNIQRGQATPTGHCRVGSGCRDESAVND